MKQNIAKIILVAVLSVSCITQTAFASPAEGFRLSSRVAYPAGICFGVLMLLIYVLQLYQWRIADDEIKANWTMIDPGRKEKA